MATVGVKGLKS